MARKQYEEYDYIDSDKSYTYPNSPVLINKQGITDIVKAHQNEHFWVNRRLVDLRLDPIDIRSIKDILSVHQYLFQEAHCQVKCNTFDTELEFLCLGCLG